MNTIFRYNANAKYSSKDLKGGYNSNNFSLLDVYLDEKKNIFKNSVTKHLQRSSHCGKTKAYNRW